MRNILLLGVAFIAVSLLVIGLWVNRDREGLFEVMDVPEFELINQDGQTITNKDMLGKVYVVEFFFTNCPTICPVMNDNLIEVNAEVNDPDFGVIAITIDPKRDTPEVLKEYRDSHGITNPNWHFVTGDRDYILSLSRKFNIYMGEDENTAEGLNHSGKMAVVDRNGKIRSRFNSSGVPILYYSGVNYSDEKGAQSDLKGKYHPQIDRMKEDIRTLLKDK